MIKKIVVKYSTRIREISWDLEYEINQLISRSISAVKGHICRKTR